MKGLVWLRTDLRMDDNPSLKNAFIECDEVACLYFYSPKQLSKHNEANIKVDFYKDLKDLSLWRFYTKQTVSGKIIKVITDKIENFCSDLKKRVLTLGYQDPHDYDDVTVEIDKKVFNNHDFQVLQQLPDILQEQGQPGKFKLGNMTVTVRRLEESQNSLIQVS